MKLRSKYKLLSNLDNDHYTAPEYVGPIDYGKR